MKWSIASVAAAGEAATDAVADAGEHHFPSVALAFTLKEEKAHFGVLYVFPNRGLMSIHERTPI